jgi:hypothetical protein
VAVLFNISFGLSFIVVLPEIWFFAQSSHSKGALSDAQGTWLRGQTCSLYVAQFVLLALT